MIARLSPLLLLAACSCAPDMTECKLVGTWRPVPSAEFAQDIRELGGCSTGDERAFGTDPVEHYCARQTMSFALDGSWNTPELAADPLSPQRRWKLVDDQDARVIVEMSGKPFSKGPTAVTYLFASHDEMREQPDGMRYLRVPPAK